MQVSIGGALCTPVAGYGLSISSRVCYLPNFAFDPSVTYDIVASTDGGNATISKALRYTAAPTLTNIDPCIDRGELYSSVGRGVQCPFGTTITLRGSRFLTADAVTVQFTSHVGYPRGARVTLLAATLINSSAITATLPALDNVTAATVYGQQGDVQIVFTSSAATTTTNIISNRLYIPLDAPNITSVTSTMCDSVSALQLTNCRAMAVITVVGVNLDHSGVILATSIASVNQGNNALLPSPALQPSSTWYESLTNTSLVFTLAYFDADNDVNLQTDVVYTLFLYSAGNINYNTSNAFRLSLTYATADSPTTTTSSHQLSSGAVAGIVIAAVVAAVLLVLVVLWLSRRFVSGRPPSQLWSTKAAEDSMGWSMRAEAQSSSSEYRDVEMR